MHDFTSAAGYQYPGAEPPYVLDLVPLQAGLVSITSDQRLCLFDPNDMERGPVQEFQTTHGNVSRGKAYMYEGSIAATTGEDGTVSIWDMRVDPSEAHVIQLHG